MAKPVVVTTEFVDILINVLGAMSPDSKFCKIVKLMAEQDAWEDLGNGAYPGEIDEMIAELTEKFGPEIDWDETVKAWQESAG